MGNQGLTEEVRQKKKEAFPARMESTLAEKAFPQICVVTGTSCNVVRCAAI
jgi:hypothetical protein